MGAFDSLEEANAYIEDVEARYTIVVKQLTLELADLKQQRDDMMRAISRVVEGEWTPEGQQ